jgi:hypothetical protein
LANTYRPTFVRNIMSRIINGTIFQLPDPDKLASGQFLQQDVDKEHKTKYFQQRFLERQSLWEGEED